MDWSLENFLTLAGVLVALSTFFALLLPDLRKFFVGVAFVLLGLLIIGFIILLKMPPVTTAVDEDPFSKGVHLYETRRFNSAIEEFEAFLDSGKGRPGQVDDARYYLASAALSLTPPDCKTAVDQIPHISPDPKHLGSLILDECKTAGCIDCRDLFPIQ